MKPSVPVDSAEQLRFELDILALRGSIRGFTREAILLKFIGQVIEKGHTQRVIDYLLQWKPLEGKPTDGSERRSDQPR